MSNQNFKIQEAAVINTIKNKYSEAAETKYPVVFTGDAMAVLLSMQTITDELFNYTFCEDYLESITQLVRGYLLLDAVDIEEHSENLDRLKLPETVTLNRDSASSLFYLAQLVIRYLAQMNNLNHRFELVTLAPKYH